MAVELAQAYVSIIPSFKGGTRAIENELSGSLEEASGKSGEASGASFMSKFEGKAKALAGGAGIALGGLLAKGFADSMGNEVANDKLAAQLGLPPDRAAELGKIAGKIYAGNYGESVGQVNDALRAVLSTGLVPEDATNEQLQSITTKALNVSSAFGTDLGGTTAAVGQLLRTGLAKDADEAFDIITRGFQQGADKAGDLLDTYNEYGVQFKKLGLSGAEATGLISQGLKAGARDADVVADSLKEFSIRALDGSKTTSDGFKALGLDAGEMAAKIGRGGADAAGGLQITLDKLRAIPDPVQRSQAAVALFGTQAEDLGDALFALDPSHATQALGKIAGAADEMGKTLGDNATGKLETFRRTIEQKFAGVASALGPVLSIAPGVAGAFTVFGNLSGPLSAVGGAAKTAASGLASGASAAASFAASALTAALNAGKQVAALVASKVAAAASAIATGAMTEAQWLLNAAMSANPITLIVVGLAALAAGAILAYQHFGPFRDVVQAVGRFFTDTLWPILQTVGGFLKDVLGVYITIVTGYIKLWWEALQIFIGVAVSVFTTLGEWIGTLVGWFADLPGRVIGVASGVFSWMGDRANDVWGVITGVFDGMVSWFTSLPGKVLGAAGSVFSWVADKANDAWTAATGVFDRLVSWVGGLPGKIAAAASGMFDGIKDALRSAINGVIDIWNRFRLPGFEHTFDPLGSFGPSVTVGVPAFDFPDLPHLQAGGHITRAGLAIVGEAGPELVALPGGAQVVPNGRGPGTPITQIFHNSQITARQAMEEAEWAIRTGGF